MVAVPVPVTPQLVCVVAAVAFRLFVLLIVIVSKLTSWFAGLSHAAKVVFTTYCPLTPGGQKVGNVTSNNPGVVVAVSPCARRAPPRVCTSQLTKREAPADGTNR